MKTHKLSSAAARMLASAKDGRISEGFVPDDTGNTRFMQTCRVLLRFGLLKRIHMGFRVKPHFEITAEGLVTLSNIKLGAAFRTSETHRLALPRIP